MATRRVVCFVAVCDLCDTSETLDGSTPHGRTAEQVIDVVTERWGDPTCGWTLTATGQLVCDTTDDAAHTAAHEEAGKCLSSDAMSVTFTD